MIVMKFGGTSVAGAEGIRRVAGIVRGRLAKKPVVVVSAFRGVTDELMRLAREAAGGKRPSLEALKRRHHEAADALGTGKEELAPLFAELADLLKGVSLLRELTPRTLDLAASYGERLSARLVASHLAASGVPARAWDAPEAGLVTDDRFGGANPLPEAAEALRASLGPSAAREVPVVTGYIGRTAAGEVTTLGRNGSDYTATIVGAALSAREVQIWSDTDGIMTADPRVVPEARPIAALSFEEACELAYYGGKVLHPHTLVPAMAKGIPVRVMNTFKPDHPGTEVVASLPAPASGVKSVAFKRRQRILSVSSPRMLSGPGFLARIFAALARHDIDVDMVSTSEVTVSVTTDSAAGLEAAVAELSPEFVTAVESDRAVVCVVGDGLRGMPGVSGEVFGALREAGVNVLMISQGASKNNIAFVVEDSQAPAAVAALHRRFFGS